MATGSLECHYSGSEFEQIWGDTKDGKPGVLSLGQLQKYNDMTITELQQLGCLAGLWTEGTWRGRGSITGRACVPALPGVGREQERVPMPAGGSCPRESMVSALATGCQPPDLRSQTTCHLPHRKTAVQPRVGQAPWPPPEHGERKGSPASPLCHQPAPGSLCRSQARPETRLTAARSQGLGKGTHRQGQTDIGNRDKSQSGTGRAKKVRRKEMSTKGKMENREARRETGT